jgi:hypothetical protein
MTFTEIKEQIKGIFSTRKQKLVAQKAEYQSYRLIAEELARGQRDHGVWAKALTEAKGDESVAESLYIAYTIEYRKLAGSGNNPPEPFDQPSTPAEKLQERLEENKSYQTVAEELSEGNRDAGVWAKALAKAQGDEAVAKSFYITEMVELRNLERLERAEAERLDDLRVGSKAIGIGIVVIVLLAGLLGKCSSK